MRTIPAAFALVLFMPTAFAAEPPVPKTRWIVYIDQETPNQVSFTRKGDDLTPAENEQMSSFLNRPQADSVPRPDYMRRASVLSRKLRDLFGTRVSLVEINMSNRKGISELGLSVESGKADDLAKFEQFRKFLAKNEVLTAIRSGTRYFNGNSGKIDDACLHQLSEAFPDVRRLELIRCPITGDSWKSIGQWKGLEELTVTGTNLSGKSAEALGGLTGLTRLDLNGSTLKAGDIKHAAKLPKLTSLTYRSNDTDAKWIGAMKQLSQLDLNGSSLSDAGLKQLAGLIDLTILELKGTAITDAGLVALKGMTKLDGLNLDDTKVDGSGLGVLKEMPLLSYGLRMEGTLLTGQNWMEQVPKLKSYNKGLMMVTRKSKITAEEEAKIFKMLPPMSQSFLNR